MPPLTGLPTPCAVLINFPNKPINSGLHNAKNLNIPEKMRVKGRALQRFGVRSFEELPATVSAELKPMLQCTRPERCHRESSGGLEHSGTLSRNTVPREKVGRGDPSHRRRSSTVIPRLLDGQRAVRPGFEDHYLEGFEFEGGFRAGLEGRDFQRLIFVRINDVISFRRILW